MTRVLVVTDNERVQNVFEDLENNGVLTLCTVSNLMQSDEQIANFCPEFTFVQSRISGLSGDIILRHLKKLLPPEGKTVLFAVGPQDAAQGRKQGARVVELSEAREGLAQEITTVLQGGPDQLRKKKPTGQSRGTRKPRVSNKGDAAEVEATFGDPAPLATEGYVERPAVATESLPEEAPEAEAGPVVDPPETASDPASAAEVDGVTPGAVTFAEMMQRAGTSAFPGAGVVEDKAEVASRPLQETLGEDTSDPRGWSGGGGRGPEHRSRRRPLWTFPLILFVILLPLLYLLPSQKNGAQHPEPTPKSPAPKAARPRSPVPPQSAAPVPQSKAAPEVALAKPIQIGNDVPLAKTPPPFQGEGRGGDGVKSSPLKGEERTGERSVVIRKPFAEVPAAKPTPADQAAQPTQPGLRELPPFLRGVTLDHAYAKAHPGWQRYIGARAEYKLYQEGGVYKALQVIALTGQTVPEEIFKKALQEFAGIDSYQVQSTERKQHFLVDHGRARGNIAVTVYRRSNDRRVKGLVLYYMK